MYYKKQDRSYGVSGYKGVTIRKNLKTKPYESKISFRQGKTIVHIYLGRYSTAEEAYIVRIKYLDSLK